MITTVKIFGVFVGWRLSFAKTLCQQNMVPLLDISVPEIIIVVYSHFIFIGDYFDTKTGRIEVFHSNIVDFAGCRLCLKKNIFSTIVVPLLVIVPSEGFETFPVCCLGFFVFFEFRANAATPKHLLPKCWGCLSDKNLLWRNILARKKWYHILTLLSLKFLVG